MLIKFKHHELIVFSRKGGGMAQVMARESLGVRACKGRNIQVCWGAQAFDDEGWWRRENAPGSACACGQDLVLIKSGASAGTGAHRQASTDKM